MDHNRDWWDASFAQLADEYLDKLTGKKPATYRSFRYGILRALKIIGTTVRVAELLVKRMIYRDGDPDDWLVDGFPALDWIGIRSRNGATN